METKMQRTLKQWFPDAFKDEKHSENQSDYEALRQFAIYTLHLINEGNIEREKEPFKIINLLYLNGNLFERNAIENEFFTLIARDETPGNLKKHLQLMPENLRPIYLKTILEN